MSLFLPHGGQSWCLLCRTRAPWGEGLTCGAPSWDAEWYLCPQHIQEFINATWQARTGQPLPAHLVLLVWALIVSLYPVGGLLGALLAGPLAIVLGR